MNTSIKTILAVVALGATAVLAHAQGQPATPRVLTIESNKVFNSYFRAQEENAKFENFRQNIQRDAEARQNELRALADRFKAAAETFQNPISTDLVKNSARDEANRLSQEMQTKQNQGNEIIQRALQQLQDNMVQTRAQLANEIITKAAEIGKKKGATLVLDRNALVYADSATDISDEVIAALNQGRPAPAPAVAPAVGLPAR